jgi:hypothetical protein
MNVLARVVGFVAALAVVFGLAWAVGSQVGPVGEPAAAHSEAHGSGHSHETAAVETSDVPGGLMVSENGYTLELAKTELPPGAGREVEFVITGPDGRPVTAYDKKHDKDLHLIVVRRDFSGFQHVHPTLDDRGTWTAPVDLTPGAWRVFADFKPSGGKAVTLGSDLAVPGAGTPSEEKPVTRTATVDGYTVTLAGDLVAGEHSMLTLSVSKDGQPVTDLQPYLAAYGHLVALREGDLAYLHVHPGGEPGDGRTKPGPDIEFGAEVPTVGGYHLYLDFKHDGVVRTAQFALDASRAGTS